MTGAQYTNEVARNSDQTVAQNTERLNALVGKSVVYLNAHSQKLETVKLEFVSGETAHFTNWDWAWIWEVVKA